MSNRKDKLTLTMERTESEFGALLAEGGFALGHVIQTNSIYTLIEAVPA